MDAGGFTDPEAFNYPLTILAPFHDAWGLVASLVAQGFTEHIMSNGPFQPIMVGVEYVENVASRHVLTASSGARVSQ
jgi:hypothetical protein